MLLGGGHTKVLSNHIVEYVFNETISETMGEKTPEKIFKWKNHESTDRGAVNDIHISAERLLC